MEVKQRDLMKAISKKENDLDKMQDALEKTEKKTKEKVHLLEAAREDKELLGRAICSGPTGFLMRTTTARGLFSR